MDKDGGKGGTVDENGVEGGEKVVMLRRGDRTRKDQGRSKVLSINYYYIFYNYNSYMECYINSLYLLNNLLIHHLSLFLYQAYL